MIGGLIAERVYEGATGLYRSAVERLRGFTTSSISHDTSAHFVNQLQSSNIPISPPPLPNPPDTNQLIASRSNANKRSNSYIYSSPFHPVKRSRQSDGENTQIPVSRSQSMVVSAPRFDSRKSSFHHVSSNSKLDRFILMKSLQSNIKKHTLGPSKVQKSAFKVVQNDQQSSYVRRIRPTVSQRKYYTSNAAIPAINRSPRSPAIQHSKLAPTPRKLFDTEIRNGSPSKTPQVEIVGTSQKKQYQSVEDLLPVMMQNRLFREKIERRGLQNLHQELEEAKKIQKERFQSIRRGEQALIQLRARAAIHRSQIAFEHGIKEEVSEPTLEPGDSIFDTCELDDDVELEARESWECGVLDINDFLSPMKVRARNQVVKLWEISNGTKMVLLEHLGMGITGSDYNRLRPGGWLTDELINCYMTLLEEREVRLARENKVSFKKCHFMSSFFYVKLMSGSRNVYDYSGVRRWTRRVDIFEKDRILFPINLNNSHWALAMIDLENRTVEYFDSLGFPHRKILDDLLRWLCDESEDKKKKELDVDSYEIIVHEKRIPQQSNSDDCGVFMCKFADYLSRGLVPSFDSSSMNYFRCRMAHEVMRLLV